jgi:ceramide glucosyltransferase
MIPMTICSATILTAMTIAPTAVFLRVLLAVSLVGTASSTIFLGLVLIAAVRNLRLASATCSGVRRRVTRQRWKSAMASIARAQSQAVVAASDSTHTLPPVSIFKPLHGAEPRLEENLESFFRQDYPAFEIVFGCRNASDPALAVVERLRLRYPQVATQIVLSGEPAWPSAKVWSLHKMIARSRHDYLVISDSDILVAPDFLRNVIPPLLAPGNGLVTCLYQGVPAPGFWSRLEALGMSVELPSGVITADMLEGMRFAMGSVMALRRDALEKIGGIASTADYYSDDFVLGNRIHSAGHRVVLSHYRVSHVLCACTFASTFRTQVRWMQSTRYSRPLGHLGTGLTFAVPFGILGFLASAALGHLTLAAALLAWSLLNRIVQSLAVGYGVIGDRRALRFCWLYPLRDLLGFIFWLASYCGGSTFPWRGELYRFTPGGRIVSVNRS